MRSGPINCLAFERLLDEGEPRKLPAGALAHARECAHCDRSLARARSLESALERHFARETAADAVPAGFTDRVMVRVVRGEACGVRWLALPAQPWWTRAFADPAVVLACGVAALVMWRGDGLVAAMRAWIAAGSATPSRLADVAHFLGLDAIGPALAPGGGAPWAVSTGLALGLLPVVALTAFAAWRAGERLVGFSGGVRHPL